MYLKELENVNFNVFDPRLKQEGAKKPLKFHYEILKKYFVGKY
jgi:ATP-dependent RNA circularization protein (DNA/RNA ligase family)